jgi:hypothetical protein
MGRRYDAPSTDLDDRGFRPPAGRVCQSAAACDDAPEHKLRSRQGPQEAERRGWKAIPS